jgi:hypothetical protein
MPEKTRATSCGTAAGWASNSTEADSPAPSASVLVVDLFQERADPQQSKFLGFSFTLRGLKRRGS